MPIYIGDLYGRIEQKRKVAETAPQLLFSCLESIDAALWLIAGNRKAQALVSMHNSVELAFKAGTRTHSSSLDCGLQEIRLQYIKKSAERRVQSPSTRETN